MSDQGVRGWMAIILVCFLIALVGLLTAAR